MPSAEEIAKRKKIFEEFSKKEEEAFNSNLPLSREQFKELFDYLDAEMEDCDDTLKLTQVFLTKNNITHIEQVVLWLEEREVLANVEEKFD